MEAAGAAARVPVTGTARAKRVDPDHLGRAVDHVLATPAYRQRAGELRRRLDELGAPPTLRPGSARSPDRWPLVVRSSHCP